MATWEEYSGNRLAWNSEDDEKADEVAKKAVRVRGIDPRTPEGKTAVAEFAKYATDKIGVGWGSGSPDQIEARLLRDMPAVQQAAQHVTQAVPAASAAVTQIAPQAIADAAKAAAEAKAAEQAQRDALAKPLQDRLAELRGTQNPFGQDYIHGQQQQASLAFGGQQHALSGQLAGRGMMGSGAEVAQRAALGGAQGATLMDIANQAKTQGIGWDVNKRNAGDALAANISNILLGGRGQDINQALGIASNALQSRSLDQRQGEIDYGREQDAKNYIDPYTRAFMNIIPATVGAGGQVLAGAMNNNTQKAQSLAGQGQRYSGMTSYGA